MAGLVADAPLDDAGGIVDVDDVGGCVAGLAVQAGGEAGREVAEEYFVARHDKVGASRRIYGEALPNIKQLQEGCGLPVSPSSHIQPSLGVKNFQQ